MADILSKLRAPEGATTKERRIGRGVGSGLGKTAGRGQKGQKARSKGNINKLHFQGGQSPMQRRLPKRGFRNPFPTAAWQAAGFRVRDYDRGDNEAARAFGRALGWDTGPRRINLETDLVATYSLLERL